ncbi:hypothetical protein [Agromyces aerolatus]|nr:MULTISPECIES: hypothetical protein [unclassified Agromyces]MDR5701849.1 hypothetical protein [Agromyces sp. LY-1074]MDR5708078.1 hypothetical protein [Agromyces sp. LY-1358]
MTTTRVPMQDPVDHLADRVARAGRSASGRRTPGRRTAGRDAS